MNNWTNTTDAMPPAGVRCVIETIDGEQHEAWITTVRVQNEKTLVVDVMTAWESDEYYFRPDAVVRWRKIEEVGEL